MNVTGSLAPFQWLWLFSLPIHLTAACATSPLALKVDLLTRCSSSTRTNLCSFWPGLAAKFFPFSSGGIFPCTEHKSMVPGLCGLLICYINVGFQ